MSYIDKETAKETITFLNTDSFDKKLEIIVDGVNEKIAKGTNQAEADAELKLLAAEWVEYEFSKIPGAKKQSDGETNVDYKLNENGIPLEFSKIMESYLEDEETDDEMSVDLF